LLLGARDCAPNYDRGDRASAPRCSRAPPLPLAGFAREEAPAPWRIWGRASERACPAAGAIIPSYSRTAIATFFQRF
jgi:hypothetical protein